MSRQTRGPRPTPLPSTPEERLRRAEEADRRAHGGENTDRPRSTVRTWKRGSTEHTIATLSKARRRALDLIAINRSPRPCADATLAVLEGLGLITFSERTLAGWPPVVVRDPVIQPHAHIAWCAVCSREVTP